MFTQKSTTVDIVRPQKKRVDKEHWEERSGERDMDGRIFRYS